MFKKCLSSLLILNYLIYINNIGAQASHFNPITDKVDFHKSMEPLSRKANNCLYHPQLIHKNKHWSQAYNLYTKHILKQVEIQEKARIPKIIHQIWLGSTLPKKFNKLIETWKTLHPTWKYKLWTDKDIDALQLHNSKAYKDAQNLAQKADIARYEILYRFGGLYVDTDFECIQPFDIWHHSLDFYVGIEFNKHLRANNALIGAAKGHPILKACVENLEENFYNVQPSLNLTPKHAYIEHIVEQTGPAYLTKMVKKFWATSKSKITLFPNTFFYPFNHQEEKQGNIQQFIKPETFAMHHWYMSWVPEHLQ